MDDAAALRHALLDESARIRLRPRPVAEYVDVIDDWASAIVGLQRKRLAGELSRDVILPAELRDVSMFMFAALVRQVTEASARGEDTLEFGVDLGGALALETVDSLRVMAAFLRSISANGVFESAPRAGTILLLDEMREELAARVAGGS